MCGKYAQRSHTGRQGNSKKCPEPIGRSRVLIQLYAVHAQSALNCGFRCIGITPPKHKGDINAYAFLKDANKCVGCGMCYDACPLKAISMEGAEGE